MPKKDFELIAKAIKTSKEKCHHLRHMPGYADIQVNYIAGHIADALATTDPAFDRARFLAACGL